MTKNVSPIKSNKLKECILDLKSKYLNDAVEWDIYGIDPDTNKIFLKEYRRFRRLKNGKFFPVSDMVNLIKTNGLACKLLRKGYYWNYTYVDGVFYSEEDGRCGTIYHIA